MSNASFEAGLDLVSHNDSLSCHTYDEFGRVAVWFQGLQLTVCIGALLLKRHVDVVRRPWKVWCYDASKQLAQALLSYFLAVCALAAFRLLVSSDVCHWCWINLMLDCTVGVVLLYILLQLQKCLYKSPCRPRSEVMQTGEYGQPPSVSVFRRQLFDWLSLVLLQRCVLLGATFYYHAGARTLAEALLSYYSRAPRMQVFVVVFFSPLCCNIFAVWFTDCMLQSNATDEGLPIVHPIENDESLAVICGKYEEQISLQEDLDLEVHQSLKSFSQWMSDQKLQNRDNGGVNASW